jgi:hypothetical protein
MTMTDHMSNPYENRQKSAHGSVPGILHRLIIPLSSILIIAGLVMKSLQALSMSFNSDTVLAGLLSQEIGLRHNFLLKGHIGPYSDPFYFPELFPIHLFPQILSGYNPDVLRLTAVIVFFINVAVFSYIIHYITKSQPAALVFGALIINLPPASFSFFFQPFGHNSTLTIAGICIILVLWFMEGRETRYQITIGVIALLLLYLTYFSDIILGVWLVIPLLMCYFFVRERKRRDIIVFYAGVLFCIPVVNLIKDHFFTYFVKYPLKLAPNIPFIFDGFVLFIQSMLILLIGIKIENQVVLGVCGFIFIVLIVVFGYLLWINRKIVSNITSPTFFFSILCMFMVFLITDLALDIGSARYLLMPALGVYLLVILCFKKRTFILPAFLILAIIFLGMNIPVVLNPPAPHADEYQLIKFLEDNHLKTGYAQYWDANLLTYLSGGDITIRSIEFVKGPDGKVVAQPFYWNTFVGWINDSTVAPPPVFFMLKETHYPGLEDYLTNTSVGPETTIARYKNYSIMIYSG